MKRAVPLEDFFCSLMSFLGTARFIYQRDGEGCEHRRLIDVQKRDEWCERAAMRGGPAVASTLRGGQGPDVGVGCFFGGQ